MHILVFGDIHMACRRAEEIPAVKEADLIVLNGDITNYGGIEDARGILAGLLRINPNILAQFGNLDLGEVNDYFEDLGLNLHGRAHLINGEVCLVGVGGSNPTPFATPSEFPEKDLARLARRAFQQADERIKQAGKSHGPKIPVIFISHSPPFNTQLDRLHSGKHVGSTAIRTAIEKYQPDLCITGHIHEAKGQDKIGNTPILNPGTLQHGGWVSIRLHKSQLEATIQ